MNHEDLIKRYQELSDERLIKIATSEAAELKPAALEVLKNEIARRGLHPGIQNGIEQQFEVMSAADCEELKTVVVNCPCPYCGKTDQILKGGIATEVISFIFFTNRENLALICCSSCLKRKKKSFFTKTLLFGWWGLPMGPIHTIQAIGDHFSSRKNEERISNEVLNGFVSQNAGYLLSFKEIPEKISLLLK